MIKKTIHNFLGLLGLEIRRISNLQNGNDREQNVDEDRDIDNVIAEASDIDEIKLTKVGKFEILINSNNELSRIFEHIPQYSSELGRLVAATQRKYPELTLIDIGANVGDTVAIARSAADIPIVCIEGDDYCFNLLKQNIMQFSGVSAYKLFLGEKSETVSVIFEKLGWNTTIIPSQQEQCRELKLINLDDFLQNHSNIANYKVLKIDTEGFDTKIIRGGLNYIKTVKPILYFEYNRDNMTKIGEDGISTLFLLEKLGYNNTLFYEAAGRFVLSTSLRNRKLIQQIHNYADGYNASIYYFDICIFHEEDNDLATSFIESEEHFREQDYVKKTERQLI